MCEQCELREEQERIATPGNRIIALASQDENSVLIYGHGVFLRFDFPPGVGPLKPEDEQYQKIAATMEATMHPGARQHVRIMLAMKGYTGEQLAQVEAEMDERARRPMDERVNEYWSESQLTPYMLMDDGTEVHSAQFGEECSFEQFVAGRTVVEVPFFGPINADAE